MATLQELASLYGDGDLIEKVSAALIIEAKSLLDSAPTAGDRAWAAKVFRDPQSVAALTLKYVLASNAGAALAAIQGADDATIQSQVANVVPELVAAQAGV